jgi:shikimate dehydrogenase
MLPGLTPPLQFGLIGWPVQHSLSPVIHKAALQSVGVPGDYQLFPVPPFPEGAPVLAALIERLRRRGEAHPEMLHGLNVTIPHKQSVFQLLSKDGGRLSPVASATGAVNTLIWDGSGLVGENTDAPGFLADLLPRLQRNSLFKTAVVLGAGGSARGVAFALAQAGWCVSVTSRRLEQAEQLSAALLPHLPPGRGQVQAIPFTGLAEVASQPFDLLVNCTPLGMSSQAASSPWPQDIPFPALALVYDLVYNPADTQLMKQARAFGLRVCNGLGMLVEQAALAFEHWTGLTPPRPALYQAVREALVSS